MNDFPPANDTDNTNGAARARALRPRIVVINDDETFLELMRELLEEEGYKVLLAHESDGGHTLVRKERPALVILDLRLEHPDAGWMILQALTLDPHTAMIPVIVCSADVRLLREKEQWLLQRGCMVQEKPFALNDILDKIAAALTMPR